MARNENPPFARGRTFFNGETIDTSTTPYGGTNYEGKEYLIEDTIYGTGLYVTLRVVRNESGVTLYGKRLVKFQNGFVGQRVDGYTVSSSLGPLGGYPVDEAYAANGVVNHDLFYIVTGGPCAVKNGTGVATTTVITAQDPLVALTAAASTGASTTDAGRIRTADFSGATSLLANNIHGIVGHAMTAAATSGNTNNDILVLVGQTF